MNCASVTVWAAGSALARETTVKPPSMTESISSRPAPGMGAPVGPDWNSTSRPVTRTKSPRTIVPLAMAVAMGEAAGPKTTRPAVSSWIQRLRPSARVTTPWAVTVSLIAVVRTCASVWAWTDGRASRSVAATSTARIGVEKRMRDVEARPEPREGGAGRGRAPGRQRT